MKKMLVVFLLVVVSAVQAFACAATTKKGTRCKRAPVPGSAFCWQHGGRSAAKSGNVATTTSATVPANVNENRCKAITKAGAQCKRNARQGSKYCWQHEEQSVTHATTTNSTSTVAKTASTTKGEAANVSTERTQCTAMTKSGKRCTRKAQPNSSKCWQHQ